MFKSNMYGLYSLSAFGDAYPVAVVINGTLTAERRDGTADMLAECNQQGIKNTPVGCG
jgi:hypothetical protein